jgi:hypothetical protein
MSLDMTTDLVGHTGEYLGGVFVAVLGCGLRSLVKDMDKVDSIVQIIHFKLQIHSRSSPCVSAAVPSRHVTQDRGRAKNASGVW